ncbi:MAG: M28 family peptidase [Bacillus sp. (in: Bacteria)]|nr:M28 family peptidase [Bacillus sp. (in: firmicutes)]
MLLKKLLRLGYMVEMPEFDCIDWDYGGCFLSINKQSVEAYISPYSLPCHVEGPLSIASSMDELKQKDFSGKIAVLHGELCQEQLMPKNFSFYIKDRHKQIIDLLERKKPMAIVAIISNNSQIGKDKPRFPLIEDGDFQIPSVYLTESEGKKILHQPNGNLKLIIDSTRVATKGCNVIGYKKGTSRERLVFSAHIDTKRDTPGALDNATGVTVLLALANLLQDYDSHFCLEFVLFNGEDFYAQSGERLYLEKNAATLQDVVLNVNVDGAGYKKGKNSFCYFNSDGKLLETIKETLYKNENFVKIDEWHQGDHMLFVMNDIPAIAISSENIEEIVTEILHTSNDHLGNIDVDKLTEITLALKKFVEYLSPPE